VDQANLRKPPVLDGAVRARLIALLRDDILRLQDLLDMDLSDWLQVERGRSGINAKPGVSGAALH
jgi:hypothetical protein